MFCSIISILFLFTGSNAFSLNNRTIARPYVKELTPVAHSHWGSWGTAMFCPDNSWAAGFGLKVEFDQGSILDDSALNGVVLKCYDAAGNNVDGFNSVTSTVGGLGSWVSNIYCSGSNNFITGVRLRSEDGYRKRKTSHYTPGKGLDETAANNVDFSCAAGDKLDGNGMYWGYYSDWETCPSGSAVCGLKTRVQAYEGALVDDTSLNEIKVYCCDLSSSSGSTTTYKPSSTNRPPASTTTTRSTSTTTKYTNRPPVSTTTTSWSQSSSTTPPTFKPPTSGAPPSSTFKPPTTTTGRQP